MPTQLPRVPSLMPSSFATLAIGRDVSITIFTASSLNSGEKLFFGRGNYFTFPDIHPIGWTVRKLRGTSVAGPGAAALGELAKRVAGEVAGVVAAVRSLAGPERRRRQPGTRRARSPAGRHGAVRHQFRGQLRRVFADAPRPFTGCLPPAARAGGSRRQGLRARIRRPGRRTGAAPAR